MLTLFRLSYMLFVSVGNKTNKQTNERKIKLWQAEFTTSSEIFKSLN